MSDEPRKTLTREELHALVWSTPVERLAKQYGLSDRGFAKICERHLVPVPPRGYWAKLEAGHPVKRTPLRAVHSASLESVHITTRHRPPGSDYLMEVLAAAKSSVQGPRLPTVAKPSDIAGTPPLHALEPPACLPATVYPAVSPFLRKLRELQPDRDGYVSLGWVKVPPAAIERVGIFMSALVAALEAYDFTFVADEKSYWGFAKDGYTVGFGIQAPRKRVPGGPYSTRLWDNVHVGRLAFNIWSSPKGCRSEWADAEKHRIEAHLSQMVDNILVSHVVGKQQQAERAVEQARRDHLIRRRKMVTLRAEREKARTGFLEHIDSLRQEVDRFRAIISAVPTADDTPPEYQRMIAWANSRLSVLEAQISIDGIQASLIEYRLYPEPDDLHDPEGDPPPKQNSWDD